MDPEIIDLATGKQDVDVWPILPTHMYIVHQFIDNMMFRRNFFLLSNMISKFWFGESILVLNLESRKKFWMRDAVLENQIREKLPDVDDEGDPFNINNYEVRRLTIEDMNLGENSIEIIHRMKLNRCVSIGQFSMYHELKII